MSRLRGGTIWLTVATMAVVTSLVVGVVGGASQARADISAPGLPGFQPCLEAQTAAPWNYLTAPLTNDDKVERQFGLSSLKQLEFTATGPEVNVAAPGVLINDVAAFISVGDSGVPVPAWNLAHISKVTAELVTPPRFAKEFTLNPDGSFRWVPVDGYNGLDSFEYVAEYNGLCGVPATVTISATSLVYAQDDTFHSYGGDAPLDASLFGVLENDLYRDPGGLDCYHDAFLGRQICLPRPATVVGQVRATTTDPILNPDGSPVVDPSGQPVYERVTHNWGFDCCEGLTNPLRIDHGKLTILPNGTFTYEPDPGWRGTDTFSYLPSKSGPPPTAGGPTWGNVTLTVQDTPPPSQTHAFDDTVTGTEDTPLSISPFELRANDQLAARIKYVYAPFATATQEFSFRTLHGRINLSYSGGSATVNEVSGITYTPDLNYHGLDWFNYIAEDIGGTDAAPARVLLDITAVADPPVANPDFAHTKQHQPITINLLANDTDDDNAIVPTAIQEIAPQGPCGPCQLGVWELNGDGTVTYTPDPGFVVGHAFYGYRIFDADGLFSDSQVDVQVSRDDAVDDSYGASEDTVLDVAAPGIRTNDINQNDFMDVLQLVAGPAHGTLDLDEPTGAFRYTPSANYSGKDTFTYRYIDTPGTNQAGDLGTVTIDVAPVNDAPKITLPRLCLIGQICDAPFEVRDVEEGGTVTVNGYVTDAEFQAGTLTIAWGDGSTTAARYPCVDDGCPFSTTPTFSDGFPCAIPCATRQYFRFTHTYLDDPPDIGDQYTITMSANDGAIGTSTTQARVRNVAPTLTLTSPSTVQPAAGSQVTITVTVADPNDLPPVTVDWGDGTSSGGTRTSCGVFTFSCAFSATHTYDPGGRFTATVHADDGDGGTDTETVSVLYEGAPLASDAEVDVGEDELLDFPAPGLLLAASDPTGEPLVVIGVTQPAHGTVEADADGAFRFTPEAEFSGDTSFTYTVQDASGLRASGTFTVRVAAVNDVPVATSQSLTTDEDVPVELTLGGTDVDGDPLTFVLATQPAHGTLTPTPTGLRYTPDANFSGADSFAFTANDGQATSAPGTVAITVRAVNSAPTVSPRSATTDEDTPVTVTPLGSDVDGDGLTYAVTTQPAHGSAAVTLQGLLYTPNADFFGTDSFTYTANDGSLTSASATVTVTVNPVDDPTVADDTQLTTLEDTKATIQPTATDPDNPVTFQLKTAPAHGTVTGVFAPWEYTPASNYAGTDSFTYEVGGGGQILVKTVFISVTPVNDAPTAADTPVTTNEDTAEVITPPTNDVDGDALVVAIESGPAHGTAVQSAANSFLYTPAADFSGTDSFTYRASDGTATSAERTVTITVNAINDAPTVSPIGDVTVVYSDAIAPITVTASDQDSGINLTWSLTGLPAGLALAGQGGSATIGGTVTAVPASYPVTVKACDPSNACGTSSFTVTVAPETATVRLTQNNPHAVATMRGGAPAMTFTARVTDAADGSFGDVNRIQPANLSLRLLPIGGGTPLACPVTVSRRVLATTTSPGFVDLSCSFAAGVNVDVYQVVLTTTGLFAGSDESVLAVYDPQAQGASGAGAVDLGGGSRGEYAFTAASGSKGAKGKVVYVEKDAQGNVVHRVFGPNLQAMAVSGSTLPITASITGKAVVDGVGNYGLIVTAVDGGASGDQFGLRITAPPGAPSWPTLTFAPKPVLTSGVVTVR